MRTNLRVPFADKDEAKRLGARWDPAKKLWYVHNIANLAAFARWLPAGTDPTGDAPPPTTTATPVHTGARYFVLSCDCLPWVGCPQCGAAVDARGWRA